ncbi:N-acetylmuramoyl-L-alanine amidase [Aurantiacibacter xanthus]|uniref:N-acetylmuramoyl-L-alanine amidase n=1 Tax=Aurantiacibacter xanthus TaxID=1784712 RepID=A0A3A1P1V5_9SPHN|nr:N-acetylmuramoyl-L-alanine amidase [Aurantiacibacter xanthus]RIV83273.1 N-acetylmuramoyl-L-alanine amidase [Aurantiacibacter xanthus]
MDGAPLDPADLVDRHAPSPNWNERQLPISMLVLHYTDMVGKDAALERMCDPEAQVSAHYLIEEDGTIIQLVDEDKRAWHAGRSVWRGVHDVNSASIGIELDHPGHTNGYRPFADAQIAALIPLVHSIVKRHDIPRANVVAHSDIAPDRKVDPGELFPWDRLAQVGLCLARPERLDLGDPLDNDGAFLLALDRFGYDITDQRKVVEAFQRRWRPEQIDGVIDAECRAILFQLLLDRDRGLTR